MDALIDLFAMHFDILRRRNADADLVALYTEHGDRHRITDHQNFADATCQDKHGKILVVYLFREYRPAVRIRYGPVLPKKMPALERERAGGH